MQYPYGVSKKHDEGMKIFSATKIADCNGSKTGPLHLGSNDKNHGTLLTAQNASGKNLDVHFQHVPVGVDGRTNCQPKASCIEDVFRRGAKRRKSGSIRRFMQAITSFNLDCSGNAVPVNISACDGVGQLMLGNSDAYRKKKSDSFRSSITKLIKQISYSASVTNNIQDVSVTFVAMSL